jgi:hypothetical protein
MTATRETFTGGYDAIIRWLAREERTEKTLRFRLWNHYDIPESERGAFWTGEREALIEAINVIAGEGN